MQKGYQNNYSLIHKDAVHSIDSRLKKAKTILAILNHYFNSDLSNLRLLDIGASTGIIDHYLAQHVNYVVGIDIDKYAIEHANINYKASNLLLKVSDAMDIDEAESSFDIIICSHVYEHVPDQRKLMQEIHRLLKTGGICYFSAGNRLNLIEPHYQLPLLSIMPHFFSHIYLRLTGKGKYYYEEHLTYWGLKRLVRNFKMHDYTNKIINSPANFNVEYMLPEKSVKLITAKFICKYFYWLVPGYIWLLEKN